MNSQSVDMRLSLESDSGAPLDVLVICLSENR
jgi:hypothetical protein